MEKITTFSRSINYFHRPISKDMSVYQMVRIKMCKPHRVKSTATFIDGGVNVSLPQFIRWMGQRNPAPVDRCCLSREFRLGCNRGDAGFFSTVSVPKNLAQEPLTILDQHISRSAFCSVSISAPILHTLQPNNFFAGW